MRKTRRHFSATQKAAIVRSHLIDGVSVARLCKQHEIQASVLYHWTRRLFDRGAVVFAKDAKGEATADDARIQTLESAIEQKSEFLGELMKEHIEFKKREWGTLVGAWVPRQDA